MTIRSAVFPATQQTTQKAISGIIEIRTPLKRKIPLQYFDFFAEYCPYMERTNKRVES
jgi:hypothetical protein